MDKKLMKKWRAMQAKLKKGVVMTKSEKVERQKSKLEKMWTERYNK